MAKVGKRTRAAREAFAGKDNVSVEEAVALIKGNASAKFDETVEIAMNLGVDPRHADQMVRGVVGLPNGTGKSVRVAVFARGPAALAEIAGKSPAYLARSFRAHLGATPTEWINARRMAHAARLMTGTDLSLTRVAEACGIETPSHFHALFKAHHGAPPAKWRRAHRRDIVQPPKRTG